MHAPIAGRDLIELAISDVERARAAPARIVSLVAGAFVSDHRLGVLFGGCLVVSGIVRSGSGHGAGGERGEEQCCQGTHVGCAHT